MPYRGERIDKSLHDCTHTCLPFFFILITTCLVVTVLLYAEAWQDPAPVESSWAFVGLLSACVFFWLLGRTIVFIRSFMTRKPVKDAEQGSLTTLGGQQPHPTMAPMQAPPTETPTSYLGAEERVLRNHLPPHFTPQQMEQLAQRPPPGFALQEQVPAQPPWRKGGIEERGTPSIPPRKHGLAGWTESRDGPGPGPGPEPVAESFSRAAAGMAQDDAQGSDLPFRQPTDIYRPYRHTNTQQHHPTTHNNNIINMARSPPPQVPRNAMATIPSSTAHTAPVMDPASDALYSWGTATQLNHVMVPCLHCHTVVRPPQTFSQLVSHEGEMEPHEKEDKKRKAKAKQEMNHKKGPKEKEIQDATEKNASREWNLRRRGSRAPDNSVPAGGAGQGVSKKTATKEPQGPGERGGKTRQTHRANSIPATPDTGDTIERAIEELTLSYRGFGFGDGGQAGGRRHSMGAGGKFFSDELRRKFPR